MIDQFDILPMTVALVVALLFCVVIYVIDKREEDKEVIKDE